MFLIFGISPFLIVSVVLLNNTSSALSNQVYNQLDAVRGIKKAQIENFFVEREQDLGVLTDIVDTLRNESISKLIANREIKKGSITSYFKSIQNQVITFSENQMIVEAMLGFDTAFNTYPIEKNISTTDISKMRDALKTYYTEDFENEYANQNNGAKFNVNGIFSGLSDKATIFQYNYISRNKKPLGSKHLLTFIDDGSNYSALHAKVHPIIRGYLEKFSYYDIFLVDAKDGIVKYSVFKELDYATSLKSGPWADSGLAKAYREAMKLNSPSDFVMIDYSLYTPSYDAPAGFISSPIYNGTEKIGVLIFQMPLDRITEIMSVTSGLGETGETILVGSDYLMRSDSRLDTANRSVIASFKNPKTGKVRTSATQAVFEHGETGIDYVIDYRNQPTLIAYTPIDIGGVTWSLNAKMDIAEMVVPIDENGKDFYTKYIEKYGYYDLFLIDPTGYVFYSVTKGSDYQTNMVNGPYVDSGLGKLVQDTLKTGEYGLSDFSPYPPSNGDPAAFIAKPVTKDGKTELIVALQLSMEAINHIMQQRDGMGETGETYLVGYDYLMRSDSYLDPKNHSVKASFATPSKGTVNSVAVKKALDGQTGSEIVIDYNGNPVLSSYAPLQIGGFTWALLAEIDEAEAFAVIEKMNWLIIFIGLFGSITIVIIGFFIARSISEPIVKMTRAMENISKGNTNFEIPKINNKSEIGSMASTLQVFKENLIETNKLRKNQQAYEQRPVLEKQDAMDKMANDFE